MAATIRQGRVGDADFVARTVLSAQRGPVPRGWIDIALGCSEPQVLAFLGGLAVAEQTSWYHASQFLIAEVEGTPAAALCAMPSRGMHEHVKLAFEEVARERRMSDADLAAIFARGAYARNCWVQGGDEDWLIEHVASQPAYRGRGLMQALIEQAIDAGRSAGFPRASISFVIGNEAAERCYAKAGFSFAEEKRDRAFEALTGVPGFRRVSRSL